MPPLRHWIVQYLFALVSMFVLLMAIDLLSGETLARTWPSNLAWAAAASAIFTGTRYRNMKRGMAGGVSNRLDRK